MLFRAGCCIVLAKVHGLHAWSISRWPCPFLPLSLKVVLICFCFCCHGMDVALIRQDELELQYFVMKIKTHYASLQKVQRFL